MALHPLASVTVTLIGPALRPVAVAPVWPLLHANVKGACPSAVAVTLPSLPPWQDTSPTVPLAVMMRTFTT